MKQKETLSQTQQLHSKLLQSSFKLVDKLSTVTKGNNKEADARLSKLRKTARSGTDLTLIATDLDAAIKSITDLEKTNLGYLKELRDCVLVAGEALQATKGMDDGLRRQLRMLVNKLKSQDSFVFSEIQPLTVAMLGAYQSVKNQSSGAQLSNKQPQDNNNVLPQLIDNLKKLSNNEIIKPRLNEFNNRIDIARSDNEKLELCLKFFEEVVDHFSQEYKQTQKLILSINAALEDVHQTLLKSLQNSKDYGLQIQKLDDTINKQIDELSKNANEAKSVDKLKQLVDQKLDVITTSIQQRDNIDKQRTLELDSALQQMESKLSKLEERTEFYRKKWLEEKARSDTDSLTGLPNRGAYDKRFGEEYKRWSRHPEPLCLAVIDIDHFKKINDKFGHSVGDKTLQIVSQTLRKNLRASDYLARYGGEEFVCLLLATDAKEMMTPLEKVRKAVESIPFKVKNDRLNITISVGVTMLLASDNVHTVFDRADKALYEAKNTGRNKICYKK